MAETLDSSFSEFMTKTGHIRRWLILEGEGAEKGFSPELAANVRGWSLVWMCACAETFWGSFLEAACLELSKKPPRFHRRYIRAQAVYLVNDLSSSISKDLEVRWDRSFDILTRLVSADRTQAPISIPYDGKTLRPRHVDLLWKAFDLPESPFPSMIHRQSLETLADDRNDIAHGRRLPATVGRLRTKTDVTNTLSRLEETVESTYRVVGQLFRN
jgi:hypothetical protein